MNGEGTLRPDCVGCRVPMLATAVRQKVEECDGWFGQPAFLRLYQVSYRCIADGCELTAIKGWYRSEVLPKLLNPAGNPSVLWL